MAATILFLILTLWYYNLPAGFNTLTNSEGSAIGGTLPPNLEDETLKKFDDLVHKGEILWEPSETELYDDHGFQFEFRQTTAFNKKPSTGADDPGRKQAGGPFMNPRPNIVVLPKVGPRHRLLFNEFCVWRPMLLLTTTTYERQTDALNLEDLSAALALLRAYKGPYMMIYNCGVNGGSSQGHKHMQIHPQPEQATLYMANAASSTIVSDRLQGVPYKHFVLRIPPDATPEHVLRLHDLLLERTQAALRDADAGEGYNVVMTTDFIGLIPRRRAKTDDAKDVFGINAAGMMGLVTVRDQRERERWRELGYAQYLTRQGLPINDHEDAKGVS
ncbi:Diadenosine 5',5'''-P1,P4-tetraphosphate phosphorylase 2 [Sphaceloma murrayae]|uniref:Diadenosine 5',5'''-P1,P4-tetraphosphate phosphorylase 2 n=1 Tax=Sphaceloma murrayae TaxID=2082308 RepID=A0A2K1R1F3_9PEZI|nr:Diadenosine 5',5'''-P1,P4-tetraphosphate phosphorylase 2 [Sphaceloma murrayae]